jgi:hypothetical protein
MQARTASRSRFNSYHNKAPNDQSHTGGGAERHPWAGLGFHRPAARMRGLGALIRSGLAAIAGERLPLLNPREIEG